MKKILIGCCGLLSFTLIALTALYLYHTVFVESLTPPESAPLTTKFITVDQETLAYGEIDNQAPQTVLMVGGLSAWSGTWERTMTEANMYTGGQYNFIALDLPPFGYGTVDETRPYYRDIQAERIHNFIEAKGLDRVILVGHSYGGGPVTEYALTLPEKVDRLILIAAVVNLEEKRLPPSTIVQIDWLRKLLIGTLIHIESFGMKQLGSFVYIKDNIDSDLYGTYTRYFDTKGATRRLATWLEDYLTDPLQYRSTQKASYADVSFPVRLIWGEEDTLTPIALAEELAATIPEAKLERLQNVGHIPMIEDYEQFDAALTRALTE